MAAGTPNSPRPSAPLAEDQTKRKQRPLPLMGGRNRWLSTLEPPERYELAKFLADQSSLCALPSVRISSRGVASLRADKAQNPLLDYTFVRPLGKGRFGKVGLYRHKRGVHHAIKKVPLTPYSFDEFRALIAACRHRARMVDLKKVFIVNNTVFLVMEPLSRELTQREFDHLPYNMRHQKLPEFDLDDRREENMMVRKGHDGGFDQVVHIDLGVLDGFGYARLLGALEQAAIEFQSLAGRLGLQPAYRPELESVTPPFGDGGDPRSGR